MVVAVQGSVAVVHQPTGPNTALNRLEAVARPGDVVAVTPVHKYVELDWALGVRSDDGRAHPVDLDGAGRARAIALTAHPATDRIWLLDFHAKHKPLVRPADECAPAWKHGSTRIECLWSTGGPTAQTVRVAKPGSLLAADVARLGARPTLTLGTR